MKIAIILNAFYPYSHGGTEAYSLALAKGMQHIGHEVLVIVPHFTKNMQQPTSYLHEGIMVKSYEEPTQNSKKVLLGIEQAQGLENYKTLIREEKPDIAHFQMVTYTGINVNTEHVNVSKQLGIKTIVTMHLAHYTCLNETLLFNNKLACDGIIRKYKCSRCYLNSKTAPSIKNAVVSTIGTMACDILGRNAKRYNNKLTSQGMYVAERKKGLSDLTEYADLIIPITNWYAQILKNNGVPANKLHTVKQGYIPSSAFNEASQLVHSKKLDLVFLGRISPLKGLHLALEALIGIDTKRYRFEIYGGFDPKDSYLKQCSSIIDKHKLNAEFKGNLQRDLVLKELSTKSALVLPSMFSEMSPLVIQEAFYAGIPVIGSNVHGITEQVTHQKDGLIFSFGKVNELRKIFTQCIGQPNLLNKLRKHIDKPRPFEHVVHETNEAYTKLSE